MRGSSSRLVPAAAERSSRFSRLPACDLRPSADLAGRSVKLSTDVPVVFDAPLAAHHKLIGRWAASREKSARQYTRHEARRRIEQVFEAAVLDILSPFELADLRVVVLHGDAELPTAIAVICDSVGQLDLGWIEKSNVLSQALFTSVAPVSWRATVYQALVETLNCVLPVFSYDDLFEGISMYYWDGATEDAEARENMIAYRGADPEDLDEQTLPSEMNARRPDYMLAKNAVPLKQLPAGLRKKLRRLREAHKAVKGLGSDGNAWHFDLHLVCAYLPSFEDCSPLPPLTLVSFDHFARELDDVGRHGMETGFMDVTGLCPLPDAGKVDDWFASLKLGAEFLLAAQDLINFDPTSA